MRICCTKNFEIKYVKTKILCNLYARQLEENTSLKHLRTKITPDLHLTYSKNGGNLGLVLKTIKKGNFSIKSYVVATYQNLLAEAIPIDSHNI